MSLPLASARLTPVPRRARRSGLTWLAALGLLLGPLAGADAQQGTPPPTPRAQVAAAAAATDGAPSAETQAEYQRVVTSAISEFDAGRFAEARALFLRAHELWPSARTFRTLGMTAFELRMYPQALGELQAALDDPRRPLAPDARTQVESLLERTRAFVGRYRVSRVPVELELWIDGAPLAAGTDTVLLLAVGTHELTARASGYSELRRTLQVQGREDLGLNIALEPLAPVVAPAPASQTEPGALPAPREHTKPTEQAPELGLRRKLAYASFGIGAAALITSAITGGLAIQRQRTLEDHCPDKACDDVGWDARNELLHFGNASTATLVVGLFGVGLGTYFWLSARQRARDHGALRIGAGVGLARLTLRGSF